MINSTKILFLIIMVAIVANTKKTCSKRTLLTGIKESKNDALYKYLTKDTKGNWYITLKGSNFSGYKVPARKPWAATDSDVLTTWTKLRFDPLTLTVDTGDFTYTKSTGYVTHHKDTSPDKIPYASAFDCESPSSHTGLARVDLTGTNFAIDDNWSYDGYAPMGTLSITNDGQVAEITGGGYCGWTVPTKATTETLASLGGSFLKLKLIIEPAKKFICVLTPA